MNKKLIWVPALTIASFFIGCGSQPPVAPMAPLTTIPNGNYGVGVGVFQHDANGPIVTEGHNSNINPISPPGFPLEGKWTIDRNLSTCDGSLPTFYSEAKYAFDNSKGEYYVNYGSMTKIITFDVTYEPSTSQANTGVVKLSGFSTPQCLVPGGTTPIPCSNQSAPTPGTVIRFAYTFSGYSMAPTGTVGTGTAYTGSYTGTSLPGTQPAPGLGTNTAGMTLRLTSDKTAGKSDSLSCVLGTSADSILTLR